MIFVTILLVLVLAAIPAAAVGGIAAGVSRRRARHAPDADDRARAAFRQGFLITFAVVAIAVGGCIVSISSTLQGLPA